MSHDIKRSISLYIIRMNIMMENWIWKAVSVKLRKQAPPA